MLLIWAFNIFSKAKMKKKSYNHEGDFYKHFSFFSFQSKDSNHRFFSPNSNPLDLNSNSAQKYEKISQRQWTYTLKGALKVHESMRNRVIFQKNIYKWSSNYKHSGHPGVSLPSPNTASRAAAEECTLERYVDGFQGLGCFLNSRNQSESYGCST